MQYPYLIKKIYLNLEYIKTSYNLLPRKKIYMLIGKQVLQRITEEDTKKGKDREKMVLNIVSL